MLKFVGIKDVRTYCKKPDIYLVTSNSLHFFKDPIRK